MSLTSVTRGDFVSKPHKARVSTEYDVIELAVCETVAEARMDEIIYMRFGRSSVNPKKDLHIFVLGKSQLHVQAWDRVVSVLRRHNSFASYNGKHVTNARGCSIISSFVITEDKICFSAIAKIPTGKK